MAAVLHPKLPANHVQLIQPKPLPNRSVDRANTFEITRGKRTNKPGINLSSGRRSKNLEGENLGISLKKSDSRKDSFPDRSREKYPFSNILYDCRMSAIYKKNLGEEERVEKCSNRSDTLAKVQRRSIPVEKIVIREVLSAEGVVRRGKESVAGLVSRFLCCSGKWGEQAERTRKEILQTVGGETRTKETKETKVSTRHFVGSFGRDGEGEEVQRAKKIRRFIP